MTVRADNTSYILVNESGVPVPLPFHTELHDENFDGPCTIQDFSGPLKYTSEGVVWFWEVKRWNEGSWHFRSPKVFGLRIITEAEYMESQTCAK